MNNENNEVVYLYLDDIIPNRFQPREVFNDQSLKELAISIKEHGVIQPIIVRKIGEKYEIIAGERRYKASTMVGLTKIPAIIKNMDDKESAKVALIENLQRKDLTPIEEARTYQKILDLDEMTQEDLAKTMGKSQSAISNKLRLLTLPEEVQDALLHEEISERHARSLLNVSDPNAQVDLLKRVIATRMTVRDLDKEIKEFIASNSQKVQPVIETQPVIEETEPQEKSSNVEFLGGINTFTSPLAKEPELTQTRVTDNMFLDGTKTPKIVPSLTPPTTAPVAQVQPTNEVNNLPTKEMPPIDFQPQPNIQQPINENPIKIDNLPSVAQPNNQAAIKSDTIEILDFDEINPQPKIVPIKLNYTKAIDSVKETVRQLNNQGYKIQLNEQDNNEYYEIIFRINKE